MSSKQYIPHAEHLYFQDVKIKNVSYATTTIAEKLDAAIQHNYKHLMPKFAYTLFKSGGKQFAVAVGADGLAFKGMTEEKLCPLVVALPGNSPHWQEGFYLFNCDDGGYLLVLSIIKQDSPFVVSSVLSSKTQLEMMIAMMKEQYNETRPLELFEQDKIADEDCVPWRDLATIKRSTVHRIVNSTLKGLIAVSVSLLLMNAGLYGYFSRQQAAFDSLKVSLDEKKTAFKNELAGTKGNLSQVFSDYQKITQLIASNQGVLDAYAYREGTTHYLAALPITSAELLPEFTGAKKYFINTGAIPKYVLKKGDYDEKVVH